MKTVGRISFFILLSILVGLISRYLKSDYLGKFLEDKIVELLITLLAINVATCGIIVLKLEEVSKIYNKDFSATIKEIKLSLTYQIWFIGISISTLILFHSKTISESFGENHKFLFDTILTTIFICSIDILRDTGMAIFLIRSK